jgi:hypothetical protein
LRLQYFSLIHLFIFVVSLVIFSAGFGNYMCRRKVEV